MKLNQLNTEQRNPASMQIDTMDTMQILKIINMEDQQIALCVQRCLPEIARLIDHIQPRMQQGGRNYVCRFLMFCKESACML